MSTYHIGRSRVRGVDLARGILAVALIALTTLVAILGGPPEGKLPAASTVSKAF